MLFPLLKNAKDSKIVSEYDKGNTTITNRRQPRGTASLAESSCLTQALATHTKKIKSFDG